MADLKNKRKSRAGHKSYLTQVLTDVDGCLEDYYDGRKIAVAQWKETLREQLEKITTLSDASLKLMKSNDDIGNEDSSTELLESNKLKFDARIRLSAIEAPLTGTHQPMLPHSPSAGIVEENLAPQPTAPVRARLLKLEVQKFGGNNSEWQEFWDSFESAIYKNKTLANLEKFSYLRGLLVEPAWSAIAGFALTLANYKAVINLLKKRYGKKMLFREHTLTNCLI